MCGIAGCAGRSVGDAEAEIVRVMTAALAKRGPDSEGFHAWPDAVLGHRRLAIIDLSAAGHQPMLSEDGAVGLTFNGCIYNFVELRAELERDGQRFRTRTDTEVLLRGYIAWGIDRLAAKLRGMYAFGIWDQRTRSLFLVRDRLGVKPLVYVDDGRRITFASTVAALNRSGTAQSVDPGAVLEFLEFGYVSDARTIYSEARKVPAAGIVEWSNGERKERSYWSLPEPSDGGAGPTFEEAVEETERLLLEAVRLRLQADVPIGALLSGGIDSALVCWALTKLNANVRAYSVATPGDAGDESSAAAETARRVGIEHEIVEIPQSADDALEELVSAYGEPFAISSALGMIRVSGAVKSKATVLLTGDGGDDVFLGYPYHLNYWRAQKLALRLPRFAPAVWKGIRPLIDSIPALRRPKHFVDYATGGLGAVTRVHDGLPYFERQEMLGGRLRDLKLEQRSIPLRFESGRRLLYDALVYERKTQFVGEFMTKVDGATMYHALEARSPFLDHVLWEHAALLQPSVRLRHDELKAVPREIVRRRLGRDIAERRKQGFTIPIERWLATRWKRALEDMASGSHLEREGWFGPARLREAVASSLARQAVPHQLWYALVLERWMQAQETPVPTWSA